MVARLLLEFKDRYPDGHIFQVRVWELPYASLERPHGLKYSLFYGRPGERIVGYNNERGKGDHRHYRGVELPYRFISLAKMLADFDADVANERRRR